MTHRQGKIHFKNSKAKQTVEFISHKVGSYLLKIGVDICDAPSILEIIKTHSPDLRHKGILSRTLKTKSLEKVMLLARQSIYDQNL